MPKNKGPRGRRSTVILEESTIELCCLAQMGKDNNLCRRKYHIGLTDGQCTYRLKLAKELAGMKKGDGFRKAWREGRSEYEELIPALLPKLRESFEKKILTQVERATPKVAPPEPTPEVAA
jgi:hypothetical protein